jgi:histidinol-phosphate aminotransferase
VKPLDALSDAVRRTPVYRSTWFAPAAEDAKLNHNESATDVEATIRSEILARIGDAAWHRYPDAHSARLTQGFADRWSLEPAQLCVGPGANALIARVIASLHGDATVITCPPTYYVYERLARARGLKVARAPLKDRDCEAAFDLDPDAILAAAKEAERPVLVLINPNNPTGNVASAAAMDAVLQRYDGLIVVDEAYQEYAASSLLKSLGEHPGLIVVRTLSKAAGLAGWRVGALATSAALAQQLTKLAPPYEMSLPAQIAGEVALRHSDAIASVVAQTGHARDDLAARLAEMPFARVFDSASNFLLVDCGSRRGTVLQQLNMRRVTVRDVHPIAGLHDCLRISVGRPDENDRVVQSFGAAAR